MVLLLRVVQKYLKKNGMTRFKKTITSLMERLDQNAEWISKKRNATTYAPKDLHAQGLSAVTTFKPAGGARRPLSKAAAAAAAAAEGKSDVKTPSAAELSPLIRLGQLRGEGAAADGWGRSTSTAEEEKAAVWSTDKQRPDKDDSDGEDDDEADGAGAEGEDEGEDGDEDEDGEPRKKGSKRKAEVSECRLLPVCTARNILTCRVLRVVLFSLPER